MSSTAVVESSPGMSEIAAQLRELREKADRLQAEASNPADAAMYASVSRDLFDLGSKVSVYEQHGPAPASPFGLLRTGDLKQPDQVKLMAFLAEQVRIYLEVQGGSFPSKWTVAAVAQRLHTTQDEVWYGVTYGEQAGIFTSDGERLTLLDNA